MKDMKRVTFGSLPYRAIFRDTFYSGDWCEKVGTDIGRTIDSYPAFTYVFDEKNVVEVPKDNVSVVILT